MENTYNFNTLETLENTLRASLNFKKPITATGLYAMIREEALINPQKSSELAAFNFCRITTVSQSSKVLNKRIVLNSAAIAEEDLPSAIDFYIQLLFSDDWINTSSHKIEQAKNKLKESLQFFNPDLTEENQSKTEEAPIVRLEEVRTDYRVILMVDPINKLIKVCYTHTSDKPNINPFIALSESSISSYEYASMYTKWDLIYFHKELFTHRLKQNNPQVLNLIFNFNPPGKNRILDDKAINRFKKCAATQKRLAGKVHRLMVKSLGADINQLTELDTQQVYMNETKTSINHSFTPMDDAIIFDYAFGKLLYIEPDFLISMYASAVPGPSFLLVVKYFPYYAEHENAEDNWVYHYVTDEYK